MSVRASREFAVSTTPSSLTVLQVAYPLAPVGPDAVGGAEQVLSQLDRALVKNGHRSWVLARSDSQVFGELLPLPVLEGELTDPVRRVAARICRRSLTKAVESMCPQLVHLHGIDCAEYLPPPEVPCLVTLHLPVAWYPQSLFESGRPNLWFHCVSNSQHRECAPLQGLLPPIENAVPDELFSGGFARRGFALCLGRICPEKGYHLAAEACHRAGVPLLIAGQVFRYDAHLRYFHQQIKPWLNQSCRFVGPAGFQAKRRLLGRARCLVVPSLVPETSCLVAMEALACGTPVVAFRSGALANLIEHGTTGFLISKPQELPEAIQSAGRLDLAVCRENARVRFSLSKMVENYFALYRQLGNLSHTPGWKEGICVARPRQ